MHNHSINKLLNLEDVIVKKILHTDNSVKIHLETKPTPQTCPSCGMKTTMIHDYRYQNIKDLTIQRHHLISYDENVGMPVPVVNDLTNTIRFYLNTINVLYALVIKSWISTKKLVPLYQLLRTPTFLLLL